MSNFKVGDIVKFVGDEAVVNGRHGNVQYVTPSGNIAVNYGGTLFGIEDPDSLELVYRKGIQ